MILQVRAAARRVRDDVVVAREVALERPRARDALLEPPAVRVQRAAAALRARNVHVEALRVQHARRRRVDVAEDDARDAAREHRDARPVARAGARGGHSGADHGGAICFSGRERPRRRQLAEPQRRPQPPPVREHREHARAHEPVQHPTPMVPLDVVARLLDQPVVLHARRAGRHARHAAEATVKVLDDRVAQLDRPVDEPLHQVDAPAGRVHLLVPQRIRRAGRQAEAAVDAVGDQLGLHIASTTRSASGLHAGSRSCAT